MYNNLEQYIIDYNKIDDITDSTNIAGTKIHCWSLSYRNNKYRLQMLLSTTPEFNTISTKDIFAKCKSIDRKKKFVQNEIIVFTQPTLDILLMTRAPLIYKLANIAKDIWYVYNLELDDLIQECNLCICELYRKGYYVHKKLLETVFYRRVLQKQRKKKNVRIQSLFDEIGEDITISDIIEDDRPAIQEANELHDIVAMAEFEYIKTLMSPRQLNQLLFEYANHITSNQSRTFVNTLKRRLKQKGINHDYFVRIILNETNKSKK